MKTFQEFILEVQANSLSPKAGQVARNIWNRLPSVSGQNPANVSRNIIKGIGSAFNPITGAAGDVANTLTNITGKAVGGAVGGAIKTLAPAASIAAPYLRGAGPVGAAYLTMKSRPTASGRVKTGTYQGKPVYMDK
jgi:hypothetical protein